jgi:hypothetical protein
MTWPTFLDYSTAVDSLSIVYGGAVPDQLAVPGLLILRPSIGTSGELRMCFESGFCWK